MIILKSFTSAHEAIHWLSVNPIEGASIETTPVMKSVGSRDSKLSNGNYHVVLKSEPTEKPQTSIDDIPSKANTRKLLDEKVGDTISVNALGLPDSSIIPKTDRVVEAEATKDGHAPVRGKATLPISQSNDVIARTGTAQDGTRVRAVYGNDLTGRDEIAQYYTDKKQKPTGLLGRLRNLFGKSASDEEIIKSIVENVVKSILK
jgi:hypothetical protein